MPNPIDDVRIAGIKPLIPPAVLMGELSTSDEVANFVAASRKTAERIITGEDDRLLVVVGPCSIHDPDAALEYAKLLKAEAGNYSADLFIVMRVYFEKPRTTVGWKGLINDPHLDESYDINEGLHRARRLLLELAKMEIPAGTEFLDTISPQFVADLVTWGAIGARTTESQMHRELASGLSCPVGFKNGTGGSIQIAVDAIGAAKGTHHFLSVTKQGVSAIVATKGNDSCHLILRGGKSGPNYDADNIAEVVAMLEKAGLRKQVMVDCSHGNSGKDYTKQPEVAADLGRQISGGAREIAAVMLESHLKAGNQKLGDGKNLDYGVSVTDACMDFEMTKSVLDTFAQAVRARRGG
ncbi:MAG: 3-deoxy-7-phosphoheptulonate synthase [Verrucomicrobiota bacterium]